MPLPKNRLILIDANSLLHRAYHAVPELSTSKGERINAVYGFLQIFFRVIEQFQPTHIAAAFDMAGPTFRHEQFEEYKAKRVKAPDELYLQIPLIKTFLEAMGIPVCEQQGYEADDIIGTLAERARQDNTIGEIIIVSGDMDALQLVDTRVKLYTMKKGIGDTVLYDEAGVAKRFEGLTPQQLIDYKGLRGDASDNIPGVRGIGEKTAIQLLLSFGSIESLYKELETDSVKAKEISPRIREKLLSEKEQAFFSRKLGSIDRNVPNVCEPASFSKQNLQREQVTALFQQYEFWRLLKRSKEMEDAKGEKKRERKTQQGLGFENAPEAAARLRSLRMAQMGEKVEQFYQDNLFSEQLYGVEKKLIGVIAAMEERGITIDPKHFQDLQKEIEGELESFKAAIHKEAGKEFNINSPQQLSQVLFEDLGISPKGLKKTPGRAISTAAPELEKLRDDHAIIELLLQYRELQKMYTTYIKTLPELADSQNRIHTHFDQLGTATGRLSSYNPNLQNIPLRSLWGTKIREGFITEPGWQLVAFDYSQMELRLAAHIAGDEKMQEYFTRGQDIHRMTASEVFGILPEEITDEMRYRAKALNFGVLYGMGASGFAKSAKISREEAQEFIDNYFIRFPKIFEYIEETKRFASLHGYAETIFGRKRFIPEINSSTPQLRAAAEREAINHPIQGTAADIIKMAMVQISEDILPKWEDVRMLLQIHDELLFEMPNDIIQELVPLIQNVMENTVRLAVALAVEVKQGKNWGTMERMLRS